MSIKTYRYIDLIALAVIGFLAEILTIFVIGSTIVFWMTPMYVTSVLIITLAIVRWKQWGLLLVITQTIAVFLAGRLLLPDLFSNEGELILDRSHVFNFYIIVVLTFSFASMAISLLMVHKVSTQGKHKGIINFLMLNVMIVLISQTILLLVGYFVFNQENLRVLIVSNFLTVLSNSLIGILTTLLIGNLLYKQGLYVDQEYKLRKMKKDVSLEIYEEKKYYNGYDSGNEPHEETRKVSEQNVDNR